MGILNEATALINERNGLSRRVEELERDLQDRSTYVAGVELACEQLRQQNKQLKGILQTTEKDVEHYRQQALARCEEIDTLRTALLQKADEAKALRQQHTAYKNKVFAQLYSPTPTTDGPYREQLEEISKLLAIYSNKARKAEEKANEFTAERQAAERQARLDMFAAAALYGSVSAEYASRFAYPAKAEIAYNYAEAMEAERDKRLAQTNPVKA